MNQDAALPSLIRERERQGKQDEQRYREAAAGGDDGGQHDGCCEKDLDEQQSVEGHSLERTDAYLWAWFTYDH